MAKVIKYKFLSSEINHGTEENPAVEQIFLEKRMGYSEANEAVAKAEACNGEYTVEDDSAEEAAQPTREERIAELEEALALLLSGVTE